ncbi:MAG: hypothetical protein KA928_04360 [Longilinea sp.]|nr:hypothetical protein [Longilinea sp.]
MQHLLEKWFLKPAPEMAGADPAAAPAGWMFSQNSGGSKPRVVRGERRRPTAPSSTPRPRAEAPQRQSAPRPSTSGGGFTPPTFSGGSSGGTARPMGFNLPGGKRTPIILIIIVAVIAICLCLALSQGGGGLGDILSQLGGGEYTDYTVTEDAGNNYTYTEAPTLPTRTPRPMTASGDTWLVLLYQDADDQVLEKDIYFDLNEAERVGSSEQVTILAQMDRFRAGYQGDGNWTSARRYYVTQDNDLTRVSSEMIADLGEVNMADSQTLIDFVTWGIENYPADKVVLILSDHGMGWPGGWTDPTASGAPDANSMPMAAQLEDHLYLMEIDEALGQIRSQTGLDQFEMIGMDACLMGHVEVLSAMEPHARYFVGSQEVEPSLGWAYAAFLDALTANPGMDGSELGQIIVDSYIVEDQRIMDDSARADFASGASPMNSFFGGYSVPSASQITAQLERDITLTAVDLSAVPNLINSLNNFAYAMQDADARAIAQARTYAQSFTNIFGNGTQPSYIDLGNFTQMVRDSSSNSAVNAAASDLLTAINQAVVAEHHGSKRPGATGISIYFPSVQLYRTGVAGPQSYTVAARRFAEESLWDEFLVYHYTGKNFEAAQNIVATPRTSDIRGAVAGGVSVGQLQLSSTSIGLGESILMSLDIAGENVGYIKLLLGYYEPTSNSILMMDSDYIASAETRSVDGVYYPDWGEGDFTLEFDWEPIVYAISDGQTTAVALFTPEVYGASSEEAIYSVDGKYTFADSGEEISAKLYFRNGLLWQVYGFSGSGEASAPREITPQAGDTFTVRYQWLELDAQGSVSQVVNEPGETLIFGNEAFQWVTLDAAAGQYLLGFIVEDLNGTQTPVMGQITVR